MPAAATSTVSCDKICLSDMSRAFLENVVAFVVHRPSWFEYGAPGFHIHK